MSKRSLHVLVTGIVLFSMATAPLAQTRVIDPAAAAPAISPTAMRFLTEVTGYKPESDQQIYPTEVRKIVAALSGDAKKSPILIDRIGIDRGHSASRWGVPDY